MLHGYENPQNTWRGVIILLFKADGLLWDSLKLSGVASWPTEAEMFGVKEVLVRDCCCIWSCCGVNLSFWRRSTLVWDVFETVPVFVDVKGAISWLWPAMRFCGAWFTSDGSWFTSGDICLAACCITCIILLFCFRPGSIWAGAASTVEAELRIGLKQTE